MELNKEENNSDSQKEIEEQNEQEENEQNDQEHNEQNEQESNDQEKNDHEQNEIKTDNINQNNLNKDNNIIQLANHKKCVPLEIYQKVFNDKQKLIEQLDIINKKLQEQMADDKINMISALKNKIKIIEKSSKSLENIVIKQEKSIIGLKSKIAKYEKLLNIKSEELLVKDNVINDLKEKIAELMETNKNIKNNLKISEKNEIIKLNDIINNLKNEIEINQKKMELHNIKFKNLQIKYLKLVHQNKKSENDFLLKLSKEHLLIKSKNNYDYLQIKTMENNNNIINNQTIKINDESNINLPKIFDNNLSISVNKENNKHSSKKKIM
jgi:hypothetical protein